MVRAPPGGPRDRRRRAEGGTRVPPGEHRRCQSPGLLGFVILHRVGSGYLLLVCTWQNDNELWETAYGKGSAGFELIPFRETAKGTYCVWELGAVLHEQRAWIRYLFSPRDADAGQTYLADLHPGGLI